VCSTLHIHMKTEIKTCKHHGVTEFVLREQKTRKVMRCRKCAVDAVSRRRKNLKIKAINFKGNVCFDCGLRSEFPAVYDFHHLDPNEKEFSISRNGATRSWDKVKKEIEKCILLCSNCHRIRHSKE